MESNNQAGHAIHLAVSVIVVNYNAGPLLDECIASAISQSSEIVIVDNASTDSSIEEALAVRPDIRVIKNMRNLGFATACNLGVKAAIGDYLLFLNPDCVLEKDSVERMLKAFDWSEDVGMVGGLLVNPDGSEQAGCRRAVPTPWRSLVRASGLSRFADRWPRLFFDFHLHKQPLPLKPIEVEAISGACMLVKRHVMDAIGLWDEGYFLHCEDLDLCMRFRREGWKILFVPSAKIIHERGACSKSRPIFVEWNKHKGMMRFYHKFFRHQYPGALMGLVAVGVWLRFGLVVAYYTAKRIGRVMGIGQ